VRTASGIRIVLILLLAALTGCSLDVPTNREPDCTAGGSFTASLTRSFTRSISGCAYFKQDEVAYSGFPNPDFLLVLHGGTSAEPLYIVDFYRIPGRIATGTHIVGPDGPFLLARAKLPGANGTEEVYTLTEGTITVAVSSATLVSGTLNVAGTEDGGSARITLTGTFSAPCVSTTRYPC
jgi:hypothetical protein